MMKIHTKLWIFICIFSVLCVLIIPSRYRFFSFFSPASSFTFLKQTQQSFQCVPVSIDTSKPVIKLLEFPVANHALTNQILKQLIQNNFGNKVEITLLSQPLWNTFWTQLSQGTFHANLEIWRGSFHEPFFTNFSSSLSFRPLNTLSRLGWYYYIPSTFVPPLNSYSDLTNMVKARNIFGISGNCSTPTMGGIIHLHATGYPYSGNELETQLITNFGFKICSTGYASESDLSNQMQNWHSANIPFLVNLWNTHPLISKFNLKRLDLIQDTCQWNSNAIQKGTIKCDFSQVEVYKAISPVLKQIDSKIFQFLSEFQYSTSTQQMEYLQRMNSQNQTMEELACEWIQENTMQWQTWLPQRSFEPVISYPVASGIIVLGVCLSGISIILFLFVCCNFVRKARKQIFKEEQRSLLKIGNVDLKVKLNFDLSNYIIKFAELQLQSKISAGQFADVYKGKFRGETVAIKRFRNATSMKNDQELKDFTSEAQLMANLRHPNIVLFYGVCDEIPNVCIVMEYMERGTLQKVITTKALTWATKLNLAKDVCKGLLYLHSQTPPVIHRDIKSYNVLIDTKMCAKLSDFGFTKEKEQVVKKKFFEETDHSTFSVQWAAPEVLQNANNYTTQSDIYSVGVILWEILFQDEPYANERIETLISRVVNEQVRPYLPRLDPNQPFYDSMMEFIELMCLCWSQDPRDRPSAKDVVARLDEILLKVENNDYYYGNTADANQYVSFSVSPQQHQEYSITPNSPPQKRKYN